MLRVSLLVLPFLLVSYHGALADPAAGTPGQSDDHNPHGTPPGQGGPPPGSSGDQNPHGAPPGQRIPDQPLASPPASEVPVTSPPAGGSRPTPDVVPPAQGAGPGTPNSPVLPARLSTRPAELPEEIARVVALQDAVLKFKGWEPGWLEMAEQYEEVLVDVAVELEEGGIVERWTERLARRGQRRRVELTRGSPQVWLSIPPATWFRVGGGRWMPTSNNHQVSAALPADIRVQASFAQWRAIPALVTRGEKGSVDIRLTRIDGGEMRWTAGSLSQTIDTMEALTGTGAVEWKETRTYGRAGSRTVLRTRERNTQLPTPRIIRESFTWRIGKGSVHDSLLNPTP